MNEKFVKVEVFVDTTSPEQMTALSTFLTKVGEHASKTANSLSEVREKINKAADRLLKRIEEDATKGKELEPEPEKPVKPAKPSKPTKAPKAEPETPVAPVEPEKQKPAEPEKEYKVEEVREKLKEKVSEHREEIKAKLTELGAPNVSSLNPSKYTEFVNFLEGLE